MSRMIGLARLGRAAELRYTPNGEAVANLSLAFSYGRKGEDGKRPTTWVEAALWGKLAEAIAEYLTKGSAVFVVIDDVRLENFKRADGTPGTKIAGRINAIELAGGGQQAEAPAPAPAPRPQARPAAPAAPKTGTGFDDMDDDIPF